VSVESEAIKYVIDYEEKANRNPHDVTKDKKHKGYDIICDDRVIEVKGRGKDKAPHILLNENNIQAIQNKHPNKTYYLYVVMNPEHNPNLMIFSKEEVERRRQESRIWRIPLRKEDYSKKILAK